MKKLLVSILTICAITLALAGCGTPEADHSEQDEVAGDTAAIVGESTNESDIEEIDDTPPVQSSPANIGFKVPKLTFNTVDADGNPIDDSIMNDSKVVMVNFWEPWCGPCVGEMPDLQKLYENYKDQGLLIIGAYSTTDMAEDVAKILSDCKTTYPIIVSDASMYQFMTEYVPTTIFVDSNGYLLTNEPIIGSNSYDKWSSIVEKYLNK